MKDKNTVLFFIFISIILISFAYLAPLKGYIFSTVLFAMGSCYFVIALFIYIISFQSFRKPAFKKIYVSSTMTENVKEKQLNSDLTLTSHNIKQ